MRSVRIWILIFALALSLAAPLMAPQPVHAAGVCPAPGTGIAGALNMIHDATMLTIPMARDNENGNLGMARAVENTACPP